MELPRENIIVQAEYDWSATAPSIAVVNAIAALENVDSIELSKVLGTTLYDHVDPDSLDSIVTTDGHISVSFAYGEYVIQIEENMLTVCPQ